MGGCVCREEKREEREERRAERSKIREREGVIQHSNQRTGTRIKS